MGPTTLIDKKFAPAWEASSAARYAAAKLSASAVTRVRRENFRTFQGSVLADRSRSFHCHARSVPVLVIIFSLRGNLYFYTKWFLIVYYLYIHVGLDYKTRLSYEFHAQRPASLIL